MASHHHLDCDCRCLHQRESSPNIPATSSPCFRADSTPCCTQCSPPNLASYLQNQQPCFETASTRFNSVKRQRFVNQQNTQREYDNLLQKINDLDLSLNRFSARRESHSTLKDSAARVVQTHFRSYLVRRSVSLKELTMIESSFVSLIRSSVSEASGGDDGSTSGSNHESGGDGYTESSSSQGSKGEVQVSGNVSQREVHLGKLSLMFSPPLPLEP
ncbi:unnamed protein product [Brassica napus]|uniref:(rape) hypothetical protein n=1 Tax=Brassica napus TaxID=3708 RepID=A0A816YRF5_BRANA|nr:unnamed protein product [Brassica napus]